MKQTADKIWQSVFMFEYFSNREKSGIIEDSSN